MKIITIDLRITFIYKIYTNILVMIKFSNNFDEVIKILSTATKENQLILFDIDEVVIAPKDKFLRPCAEDFLNFYSMKYLNLIQMRINKINMHILLIKQKLS